MNAERKTIVGFDAKRIVRNGTGLGAYGRTLVNALSALGDDLRLLLYAPDEGRKELTRQLTTARNVQWVYPVRARNALTKDWWRSKGIVEDLKRDGVCLFHGLSGELPQGIRKAGIPAIVTIHDLIFMRHPEYYHWWDAWIYTRKFRQTLKEAQRIIAISECTKRDIVELGRFPAERIDVIYQSCGTRFAGRQAETCLHEVARRLQLPARFVLNVGTIEARKNILLAVKALPLLPEDVHLVVVGRSTGYGEKVKRQAQRLGVAPRLHFLHGVCNEDLPAVYQLAEAFVYPSRYEGFGLPIIEAIQSGLPVVACTGSCLEEAGGPHCLYVAPDDVEGMAHALRQSLKGAPGRDERIEKSRAYVRKFENKDVVSQVKNLYRQMGR